MVINNGTGIILGTIIIVLEYVLIKWIAKQTKKCETKKKKK